MSEEHPLTDADVAAFKAQLLASMPSHGLVGNGALRRKLGWDDHRYWYIRDSLLQAGLVRTGRGKGGSVQRVIPIDNVETAEGVTAGSAAEKDLYGPIIKTLQSDWIPDHQIQDFVIHQTAHQGRRGTGGKWTRPDITLASSNSYTYVPGRPVEIRTFEIKTHDGLDVTAVYEALAHRRAAHYAHVFVHVPGPERAALEPMLDRLVGDAQEHGIALSSFATLRTTILGTSKSTRADPTRILQMWMRLSVRKRVTSSSRRFWVGAGGYNDDHYML
jgi:hypothetical protein